MSDGFYFYFVGNTWDGVPLPDIIIGHKPRVGVRQHNTFGWRILAYFGIYRGLQ